MKKHLVLILFTVFMVYCLSAQVIRVTFSGTGTVSSIDSIRATNLTTGQSIVLPGNQSLVLRQGFSGIEELATDYDILTVFPNPCDGTSQLSLWNPSGREIILKIFDLRGRCLSQTQRHLNTGVHSFRLHLPQAGLYFIQLTGDDINLSKRVLTMESSRGLGFEYCGQTSEMPDYPHWKSSLLADYILGYESGDIIHYRCMSAIFTTILTDSPEVNKNYEVDFVSCQDPTGRNYSVVKIGQQIWMAENLAYLPRISASNIGSESFPYYYVYNYEGNSVLEAKSLASYNLYGVLYNWEANKTACPTGWHLPSDNEWKLLEMHLGMSEADANSLYNRSSGYVGVKLKSTTGWYYGDNGDNSSGFNAVPGGQRFSTHGDSRKGFSNLGITAWYWASSLGSNRSYAINRGLWSYHDGVSRDEFTILSFGLSVRCVKDE